MVTPSPDVFDRDFNILREDECEACSVNGSNNISNSIDSSAKHKLVDQYISYNCVNIKNTNTLRVFHQNVKGLKYKTEELLSALCPDFPHVLCLTEHHIPSLERNNVVTDHYNLGAVYCRKILSKGGVCIFVHNSINYSNINLDRFCIDKTIEICAVKLQSAGRIIYIVAVYRAPSGNFLQFLNNLNRVLNTIHISGVEFIVMWGYKRKLPRG
jgi:hypothetical protein